MSESNKRRYSSRTVLLLLLAIPLVVCGLHTAADADLELGASSFGSLKAKPLTRVMRAAPSARFFLRVGGVAFSGVAEPQDDWKVSGLAYDASKEDGSRLTVTLSGSTGGNQRVVSKIYDWELGPIARFANSKFHACVTLFGEAAEGEAVPDGVERIINYHPRLRGSLIGLRLLQADLLAIESHAADLFKKEGEYILGEGESAPTAKDVERNVARFEDVSGWLVEQPDNFTSYVVTDLGQTITFGAAQGSFEVEWPAGLAMLEVHRCLQGVHGQAQAREDQVLL